MKKKLLFGLFWFWCTWLYAQDIPSWQTYLEQLSDVEGIESGDLEEMYEMLSEQAAHPIDLNHATREDLAQLPFLTKQQIEELVEYIDQYAPLRSVGELAMIESLDLTRRKLLSYFVTINPSPTSAFPSMKDLLRYGRNELIATGKIPFYRRKGDDNGYLGYPYKHWLRYQLSYGSYGKMGFVASQDAGEPWFAGRNKWGYDYYSFYAQANKLGKIKSLVIGRYRAKFGLGVAMNRDFMLGKLTTLASLGNQYNTIRAHSSRSEANYLQGVAATVQVANGLDLTGFASYRYIDGTLNKDSTTIATIVTSGYHRTMREMSRKHNTSEFVAGGHLQYFSHGFHVGATAFSTTLDKELQPNIKQTYRQYAPQGKSFWNASIDYGYISRRLSIQGETATGNHKALATINSISYQCLPNWSVIAIQRFYSYRYYALLGRSFSEGGHCQNESGIFLGTNWQPFRHLSMMTYVDFAYFPWARYQASQSSHAWDVMTLATYQHRQWNLQVRYRYKMKQKDTADKSALLNTYTHRVRIAAMFTHSAWFTKTQIDGVYYQGAKHSTGYMVTENVGGKFKRLQAFAALAYFHTDDYNSRLYTYERGMLYTFAFPMFAGKGVRGAFNTRFNLNEQLMAAVKIGATHYMDRQKMGTGYQEINGNTQTDLEMQLRWRF